MENEITRYEEFLKNKRFVLESCGFDVDKNTNLLLWIAQDGRVPKTKGSDGSALSAGSKDFRGKVIVSPSQGYKVSDSGYREEVNPVGVVEILCDETGSEAKGARF